MRRVLTFVLGGGAGTRLFPLTKIRAKPAVPIAGKYRLIDIALSNCINSECVKIYVLTQFLSASLNRHVSQTFKFDDFSDGFVEILAASQGLEGDHWFQGTADAIRKVWSTIEHPESDLILILPGDALYSMDYRAMVDAHLKADADITVALNTVPKDRAHHFGLVAMDAWGVIREFREKPKGDDQKGLEVPRSILEKFPALRTGGEQYLASMGAYLFRRSVLDHWMRNTSFVDFGKEILPGAMKSHRMLGHIHTGYWEDIGTIEAFYRAHMDMLRDDAPFDICDPEHRIYTRSRNLPNMRVSRATIDHSLIAPGAQIDDATIRNSMIGLRARVRWGSKIEDSILMGADYYEDTQANKAPGTVPIGIGEGCEIRRAIIDKNVRLGRGCKILNEKGVQEADSALYHIRNGIILIPKNTIIPDGTVI